MTGRRTGRGRARPAGSGRSVFGGNADQVQECVRRIEGNAVRTALTVLVGMPGTEVSGEESVAVLVADEPEELTELRTVVERSGLRAGIGGAAAVHDVGTSHREALETLERTSARQRMGVWDDVVSGGISGLIPPETARAYARDVLRPLRELDHGGEHLVPVLRTFLTHNGNRRQTAADLGIHRNTLQQRLRIVEQALGCSLEDPQVRAELWIALHVPGA